MSHSRPISPPGETCHHHRAGHLRRRRRSSPTTISPRTLDTSDEWIRQTDGHQGAAGGGARASAPPTWASLAAREALADAGVEAGGHRPGHHRHHLARPAHAGDGCARRLRAAAASTPEPSTCRRRAPASSMGWPWPPARWPAGCTTRAVVGARSFSRHPRLGGPVRPPSSSAMARGRRSSSPPLACRVGAGRAERRTRQGTPGCGRPRHPGLRSGRRRLGGRFAWHPGRWVPACPASCETVAGAASTICKMNGNEVYKFATRVVAHSAGGCWTAAATRSAISTSSCPIRPTCASSRAAAEKLGIPRGQGLHESAEVRQHLLRLPSPSA